MDEAPSPILFRRQNNIGIAQINRPEKMNTLNAQCWQRLDEILAESEKDASLGALVITGSGSNIFSAGADVNPEDPFIAKMFQALQNRDKDALTTNFKTVHDILERLARLSIPTIAALNGDAYSGGLELALACDIRTAKEGISMAFQESMLGLIPDLGGTVRLSRLIGPGRAKDLLFTCRKLDTPEALELGVIQHVFPGESFMDHVMEYVGSITRNSPKSLEAIKRIIRETHGAPMEKALAVERDQAAETILSGQCIEGITAFFTKRPPRWKPVSD